jgi:hypothetical protein
MIYGVPTKEDKLDKTKNMTKKAGNGKGLMCSKDAFGDESPKGKGDKESKA